MSYKLSKLNKKKFIYSKRKQAYFSYLISRYLFLFNGKTQLILIIFILFITRLNVIMLPRLASFIKV